MSNAGKRDVIVLFSIGDGHPYSLRRCALPITALLLVFPNISAISLAGFPSPHNVLSTSICSSLQLICSPSRKPEGPPYSSMARPCELANPAPEPHHREAADIWQDQRLGGQTPSTSLTSLACDGGMRVFGSLLSSTGSRGLPSRSIISSTQVLNRCSTVQVTTQLSTG